MRYLAAFAVLAVLLLFGCTGIQQGAQTIQAFTGGFSAISLQQGTTYVGTDPFQYQLVAAVDGSSSSGRGTFSPAQVAAFTGQNRPAGDFTLQLDLLNQTCTYALLPNPIPVFEYGYISSQYISSGQYDVTGMNVDAYWFATNSGGNGCTSSYCAPHKRKIGEIYQIDSVANYNSYLKITLDAQNGRYETWLTPQQPSSEIAGVLKATSFGSGFQGKQSCPVPSTTTVLFRAANSNTLQAKSNLYLADMNAIATGTPDPTLANSKREQFLASQGIASPYCDQVATYGTTATYNCVPASPVAIPVVRLFIKADVLGVVIPASQFDVLGVSIPEPVAGNVTYARVLVRNSGQQTDTAEVSIVGARQVSQQPTRIQLAPNTEDIALVPFAGAGIIGNYTAIAKSVNDPALSDSYSFRLQIDPYCDRTAEPGKMKVSTEYGCWYVCAAVTTDLREKSCQPFGTFEPNGKAYNRTYGTGTNRTDDFDYAGELHCTAIGKYATLNDYMDAVLYKQAEEFIAASKPHAYFLPAPVCDYAGEYGYRWDGGQAVQVGELEFYDSFGLAKYSAPAGSQASVFTPIAQETPAQPSQPATEQPQQALPVIPIAPSQESANTIAIVGAFVLALVVGGGIAIFRRRK